MSEDGEMELHRRHEPAEQRLAEIRRERGDDHPDTLTAMLDLAEITFNQGRLIATRKLEEAVVAGRARIFGDDHPDTLKAMRKLGVTLGAQGEFAAARRNAGPRRRRDERAVGRGRPGDLARRQQSRRHPGGGRQPPQAEALLQTTIATSCRVLGDQHPDTLAAMGNLAAVLWQAGNEEGAYSLQYQVVELNRAVHGPDHPSTKLAEAALAVMEHRRSTVWARPV